jgi:hypothetical protein
MATISSDNSTIRLTLTRCQGRPTPLYCQQLHRAILAFLKAIPHPIYDVGGWLGIIVSTEMYSNMMKGLEWKEPTLPTKPKPRFFFFGDISNAQLQTYHQDHKAFMQYLTIVDVLRSQLIAAIDEEFLADIPLNGGMRILASVLSRLRISSNIYVLPTGG